MWHNSQTMPKAQVVNLLPFFQTCMQNNEHTSLFKESSIQRNTLNNNKKKCQHY
jgi:hypothetical protein